MMPAAIVLCAWLLFGGTHLFLGSPPLRDVLMRRLGERAFVVVYTLIAALSLTLLATVVAYGGGDGARGLHLASSLYARWVLGVVSLLGIGLVVAALMNYFRSPVAVLRTAERRSPGAGRVVLRAPSPVERITRHPFFVGIALFAGAHALLASTLAGAVYFGGFVGLALAGIPLQDRKLRARYGDVYAAYMTATSAVPFAMERGSFASNSERPGPLLLIPLAGAALFGALHWVWTLGHGAPFAMLVVLGGLYAVVRQISRGSRAVDRSPVR